MAQSLTIKDGLGSIKALAVESGSYGLMPIHHVVPLPVTGVVASSITTFSWNTSASGTFQIAENNFYRRGLTVFNPGPHNLYIAFSTSGSTTNGFTISSISSAPTQYSIILYPSGTYVADPTLMGIYHGGYFISGSSSSGVFITQVG